METQARRVLCLWEDVAPKDLDHFNWKIFDERLEELRRRDITPVVGFLHHGSGPWYTGLLDPDFPQKLATYARAFGRRYPWVSYYTPVNAPLAKALQVEHEVYFLKALLHLCKGTVFAMREIRCINHKARLIQTEEMDAHENSFDEHRRWITFDLLSGEVGEDHPLLTWFLDAGIRKEEVLWFRENASPPAILSVSENYHRRTWERYRLPIVTPGEAV